MLKIVKVGQRALLAKPSAGRPAPINCPWLKLDHPHGGLNQAWANPRAAPSPNLEAAIEELLYQPLDLAGADWAAPDPAFGPQLLTDEAAKNCPNCDGLARRRTSVGTTRRLRTEMRYWPDDSVGIAQGSSWSLASWLAEMTHYESGRSIFPAAVAGIGDVSIDWEKGLCAPQAYLIMWLLGRYGPRDDDFGPEDCDGLWTKFSYESLWSLSAAQISCCCYACQELRITFELADDPNTYCRWDSLEEVGPDMQLLERLAGQGLNDFFVPVKVSSCEDCDFCIHFTLCNATQWQGFGRSWSRPASRCNHMDTPNDTVPWRCNHMLVLPRTCRSKHCPVGWGVNWSQGDGPWCAMCCPEMICSACNSPYHCKPIAYGSDDEDGASDAPLCPDCDDKCDKCFYN